jgi:hypothetical protein
MRRVLTLLIVAAAFAVVVPAAPAAKTCAMTNPYVLIKVTNVSCAKAKEVVKAYFKNMSSKPSGFTCHQKQYPGGVTTTCRKGNKKIKHQSAD